jgi:hypothetical protein
MAQVVECFLSMQKGVPSPVPQKLNTEACLICGFITYGFDKVVKNQRNFTNNLNSYTCIT